ncbi:type II secretion system F family protein [Shimazuella kribbensis]|uniref:type II secretion system F family protein n=1 Tax=Shimazuella kribbensis TaxID=139808 RepID=UPI000411BB38|nr:type II secretion system F family protein [Shimazuella kribbensis]
MIGLLVAVAVFSFCLMIYAFIQAYSDNKQKKGQMVSKLLSQRTYLSWSDTLVKRLEQTEWAIGLSPKLTRSSISISAVEYMLFLVVIGILLQLILTLLLGLPWWLVLTIVSTLIPFGSNQYLRFRQRAYVRRLELQLPEMCRLLSSAISAGLSVSQALLLIVQEMEEPLSQELAPICRDIQLGASLEQVLTDWSSRLPSQDFHLFIHSILIQKEAGGDLGKVMADMSTTLEERKVIQKSIDAVISQSRSTAYLLPVLSVGFVLMFHRLFGGIGLLFQSWIGIVIIILFLVLQVIGFLLVKRISAIKV